MFRLLVTMVVIFPPMFLYGCMFACIGLCMIQINTYGRRILHLLVEHSEEKIWRQVWESAPSLFNYYFFPYFLFIHLYVVSFCYLSLVQCLPLKIFSLEMKEARPWSVVIMCHLFSQKIPLFLVLYTVMATGLSTN